MTLQEWSDASGILPTRPTTETQAVSVVIDDHPFRLELWRLSDYRVYSVSGVVVWLVPVKTYCRVTFTPALTRPDAEWEVIELEGPNQAAILARLQEIVAKSDRSFKTITLEFS